MPEPVVFISHFKIRPGAREHVPQLLQGVPHLQLEKPLTLAFLAYLDDAGTEIAFLHLFADAESMDIHFEGAAERARAAYEYLVPAGWEIYGRPSDAALETMRQSAAAAGVELTVRPDYVGGFLRLP